MTHHPLRILATQPIGFPSSSGISHGLLFALRIAAVCQILEDLEIMPLGLESRIVSWGDHHGVPPLSGRRGLGLLLIPCPWNLRNSAVLHDLPCMRVGSTVLPDSSIVPARFRCLFMGCGPQRAVKCRLSLTRDRGIP
jgi:hypothetical protein